MSLLADAVVVLHFAFVVFVVSGGLLVLRWPRAAWVHAPAAAWGAAVALAGWVCPLTPLEVWLRERAGEAGYSGDFVDRYVMPLLYPDWLARPTQLALGVAVIAVNAAVYALAWRLHHRRRRSQ
jgi:hypothetical protein